MSYTLNLFVDQGADWTHNAVMYTSNTSGRFTANMALWANGAGQIRKAISSANATANITVEIYNANSSGIITLSMDNANTSSIPHGRYIYDVEVITPGGAITRSFSGQMAIRPQTTKWDW